MCANQSTAAPDLRAALLASPRFRCLGPHRGGRVVAVAGDVSHPMTFYFGACAGGVWKTTDGGRYWRNVSDGFFGTAAIGALAVADSDPNVIYAGTGEACIRNNVSHGDGVYKSTDGGRTWANIGLTDTRHIGKIVVHPHDPELIYVAALGHAFGPNDERGVFRSRDGGAHWDKVLHRSARAGTHDLAMDRANPRILYAPTWQVQRYPHALDSGGPECGLWRSTDGGDTWAEISRRPGLPAGLLGKIGVAASPARPGRVWALIEAEDGALFRSDDYGETWTRLSEESLLRTRPWYYMHVTADPTDAETVWVQNYSLWKSIDGGATVHRLPTPHGDEHALWIDPHDANRMIEGNDGGACVSFNGGASWSSIYNQPTAQLYHVTTDDQVPYRIYGSQQDNTAISIPSRSLDGAIHERDWYAPGGGESGYIAVKPDDPNIVVASGPIGRRAYNDLMTMYDHRTKQRWNITVWPELYGWGVGAGDLKYRFQWTFPIMFSRHDPATLYVAGNRIFRSTDLGANWDPVSPDLTRHDPETLRASGGPITRDNTGAEVYATVFALAESPLRAGLLWAGSDDGLLFRSDDAGATWEGVTPPELPDWALISIIEPSPHDADTAYLAATRYKMDDLRPYLYKTSDRGTTWTSITDGIPDHEFTRVIREDPSRRGLLYAGTETGIYLSFDDGGHWQRLGGNLPVVPIYDFVIKDGALVVATHGRSFWVLDDLTPFHQLGQDGAGGKRRPHLFAPRPTSRMRIVGGRPWRDLDPERVNYSHADTSVVSLRAVPRPDGSMTTEYLDAGENPPDGVVFQYYLAAQPEDGVTLSVRDAHGTTLRTFDADDGVPSAPGMNRYLWNMRLPGAPKVTATDLQPWDRPDGPLVLPGDYEVCLSVDGQTQRQPFTIQPDPRIATGVADLRAQHDVLGEILAALTTTNATINEIDRLLAQIEDWERRAGEGDDAAPVRDAAAPLAEELRAIRGELIDVHMKESQLWASGLHEKLNALFESVDSADFAPPVQAREVFAALQTQLEDLTGRLDGARATQIPRLTEAITHAGIPLIG